MDTTEQNIRMCGKAEKIQALWKPEYGDWFFAEHTTWVIGDATFHYDMRDETKPPIRSKYPIASIQADEPDELEDTDLGEMIWLPTQDQLQKICEYFLPPTKYSTRGLLEVFWEFVDDNWVNYLWLLSNEQVSMEQLWLAFTMKKKYDKVWNGKNWIKKVKR